MKPFTRTSPAATIAAAELQRSLRRFISFDQGTCLAGVGVILVVYTWLHASQYLLLLAAVVGITAGVLGLGRRPLATGDLQMAVMWVAAAQWGVSLAVTLVATFCLPMMVVAALLPTVLAVPYVDPRRLRLVNAVSFVVATLVVVLGTTQDVTGFTGDLPSWIPSAVLVAFVPFVTGLVVMVSTHNSARLTRALIDTLDGNDRLRVSERDLRESRARLAAATDAQRRRIARDLHDGAQQRLLSIALGVQQPAGSWPTTPWRPTRSSIGCRRISGSRWPSSATSPTACTRRC